MPEMQPITATSGASPAALDAARWAETDYDFALGCECADPALQIERWGADDDSQSA